MKLFRKLELCSELLDVYLEDLNYWEPHPLKPTQRMVQPGDGVREDSRWHLVQPYPKTHPVSFF